MAKHTWKKMIVNGTVCLVPDCHDAAEWLKKTKLNQGVLIDPKRPRNIQHHKKLFALLNLAVDNWPQPTTTDALLGAIKLKTGHYTEIQTREGIMKIPKSINFESMGQDAFEPFYQNAITLISAVLGVDAETLNQESSQF